MFNQRFCHNGNPCDYQSVCTLHGGCIQHPAKPQPTTYVPGTRTYTVGWDYRLVRMSNGTIVLCEVYYHPNGQPAGRNNGATICGDDLPEVQRVMARMDSALRRDILNDWVKT